MKRLTIIGLWPDDVVKYCTEKCDCRRYAFDRILYHRGGRDARERICIPVVDRSGAVTTYLDLPVLFLEANAVYLHLDDDLYICEHCRLEFYDEEECLEHEKTHSPHFDGSTNEDIAKELDALGANACSFRVGDCVMGMTVHSFKNLMSVAARALRGGTDNAGKE